MSFATFADSIRRRLNIVPSGERQGISLDRSGMCWSVQAGDEHVPVMLRCFAALFPPDALLYVEGTSITRTLREFLHSRRAEQVTPVRVGTLWPRPYRFHMPIHQGNLSRLATLIEGRPLRELCDHMHVYQGQTVLLEAYDAINDHVDLSPMIAEDRMQSFSKQLGTRYRLVRATECRARW